MFFGVFPTIPVPDSLRDYFHTDAEWEAYATQYANWMAAVDGGNDPPVFKTTTRSRCKGCGKYMSLFQAHVSAFGGHWHMNEDCMEKLTNYLTENTLFSFERKSFT
jgi:hypothetical protein